MDISDGPVYFSNKFMYKLGVFVSILIFFAGCSASKGNITEEEVVPKPSSSNTSVSPIEAYPPPTVVLDAVEAYPASDTFDDNAIFFALDKPIQPNATVVTGVGPPGLTVYLLNITFMGEQVGVGTIDDDGMFVIQVVELPSGIRIGLTADITTIGLTEEDIRPGDGARGVPQVGYFYDSYVLRE